MVLVTTNDVRKVMAGAVLVLALVGCGGPADQAGPPGVPSPAASVTPSAPRTIVVRLPPVPDGIGLSFIQQRIDEGTRRSQVRVVNGTDHTLRVRSVGVDWAGFPGATQRAPYKIASKQTVDLRYVLPRAVCTAAAGRAPIRGVVATAQGTVRRAMAEDGVRFLTRLWTTECSTRRLDAAVAVSYGDDWRQVERGTSQVLLGSLVLTRAEGVAARESVRVTQLDGSVLFDLALAGTRAQRVLAPGRRSVAVPILVRDGGRCDPHSGSQSTQTFLFRVFLRLGDGEQVARLIEPGPALRGRLLGFRDRVCAGVS